MSTTYVIIIKCVYYQFETLSETFVDKAYDISTFALEKPI